jgi:hypothetical protein
MYEIFGGINPLKTVKKKEDYLKNIEELYG